MELLRRAKGITDEWIATRQDPELGPVGAQFMKNYAETGCRTDIDPTETYVRASYCAFTYVKGREGLLNRILIGLQAESNLDSLYLGSSHERIHALELWKTPALHAAPFNPRTRIVLCPEDWLLLQERCEQDAFAKQAWFGSLIADELPEVVDRTTREPVPVKEFIEARAKYGLQGAMVEMARFYENRKRYVDNFKNGDYTYAHSVHDSNLAAYKDAMDIRDDRGEKVIFVRLGAKDREAAIRAIGGSFGPNPFGENGVLPEFLEGPHIYQKVNLDIAQTSAQQRLDELNKRLGITDYNALPELSDALAQNGLTPEMLRADSYANPAPPPQNNPALVPA
jgi:hypothetical protein